MSANTTEGPSTGVASHLQSIRRVAITHVPPVSLEKGERSFIGRDPIDMTKALAQHAAYADLLASLGCDVVILNANHAYPDAVFVEDTAVVLDEIAILTSPGAESRRGEVAGIEAELLNHRPVVGLAMPGTLDGGDVVVNGRVILVGKSARTNAEGVDQLTRIVAHFGYVVRRVGMRGCLHLKSACCALPDGRLLVNPAWVELKDLRGFDIVEVDSSEPFAADVLTIGRTVVSAAAHPRTAALIAKLGFDSRTIDLSEFAKAEGGVTCLSLVFEANRGGFLFRPAAQPPASSPILTSLPLPNPPFPGMDEWPRFDRPYVLGDVLPIAPECGLTYPLIYSRLVEWHGNGGLNWLAGVNTPALLAHARNQVRRYCLRHFSESCQGVTEIDYSVNAHTFTQGTAVMACVSIVYLFKCSNPGPPIIYGPDNPPPPSVPPEPEEPEDTWCNLDYRLVLHDISEIPAGCAAPDRAAIEQMKANRLHAAAAAAARRVCKRTPDPMCSTPLERHFDVSHHCFASAVNGANYHTSTIVYHFACPATV
ncbi:MAG: arginine deiminase-related protein [Gemmatimonadota bacterium]|nr:arginine deiminase-related protein [Gemmatimonadota bacterium]